ncbi:hypothetical protein GCM10009811_30660 [Nostocoides veronense]|uniref:Uncharacterized protein n=1 Tax=Nostocoides veronense TaxID=330836 RepID=A0ABP4Y9L5_9MICO
MSLVRHFGHRPSTSTAVRTAAPATLPAAPRRLLAGTAITALALGALTGVGGAGAAPAAGSAGEGATAYAPDLGKATAPGPLRQYVDRSAPARGTAARGALGDHSVLVQPVYWADPAPAALDNVAIGTEVRATSGYFRAATASKLTVTLNQVRPWAKISLTADEIASCDIPAIERAARAVAPDVPGNRQHLDIVFPQSSTCSFGMLASRGLSAAGDGVAFFNGAESLHWATIGFGVGSNAGLGMSNSLDCWTDAAHTTPIPLSGYCKQQDGSDPWDLMGWWPYQHVGRLSAANLRRLGAFSASDFAEVTPGQGQYSFIRPLSANTGLRGVGITLGDERYTIEYRTPDGLDDWIDDATWVDPTGVTRTDPGGGVIVRRVDLASGNPADSAVLDFHPDGKASATGRHPGLEPGESWTSPGGILRLEVVSATTAGASVKIDFPGLAKVERWSGADRYAASATISARSFLPGVQVAYVASGEVFADALSGAPVAGKDRGPILLTSATTISGAVQTELRRLAPRKIVILGGPATVSPEVEAKLAAYTTGGVERWAGDDRFSTSATIATKSFAPGVATAYIASGRVYTDALSGAPVAGKNDNPVLLVDTTKIPSSIAAELTRLQPGRIVVMGGPNTISDSVVAALAPYTKGAVSRVSGADRFATSAAISAGNYCPGTPVLYVASGRVFPDALSGAPVAGMTRGPVLLVDTTSLPKVVADEISRLQPQRIVVLGGPNTVSESVRAVLGSYLP